MNRRYDVETYTKICNHIRERVKDVTITSDFIAGFPGETEEHHKETVETLSACRFLDMHIFVYSRRPNTPAAEMSGQVPPDVGQRRSRELADLCHTIQKELYAETIAAGKPLSVLFETEENGVWYGHSDSYIPVRVTSAENLQATVREVLPLSQEDQIVYGKLI